MNIFARPGERRRIAFVPEAHRQPTPSLVRTLSLMGFNVRPVPRVAYEEAGN